MTASVPGDEYVVTIVRYGSRRSLRSDVFLNYPMFGQPDGPIDMHYFFWVLKSRDGERTIVVDTGFSKPGGAARGRTTLGDIEQLLRAAGVDPDAAPTVVITHAHYDHIGNLGLFPSSRFVLARKEYEFWSDDIARKQLFHHSVEDEELRTLDQLVRDGRVDLFSGEITVAPGVTVSEVGGHTPGQSVVRVTTSEGVVLLASDVVHYYEELENELVFNSLTDLVELYRALTDIRAEQESGEIAHVVSGHDPDTLARFTPAQGELAGFAATIGAGPAPQASEDAPVHQRSVR